MSVKIRSSYHTPDGHKMKPSCGLFANLLRCRHLMYYWIHCGSGASQVDKNPRKSFFILCPSGVYVVRYSHRHLSVLPLLKTHAGAGAIFLKLSVFVTFESRKDRNQLRFSLHNQTHSKTYHHQRDPESLSNIHAHSIKI